MGLRYMLLRTAPHTGYSPDVRWILPLLLACDFHAATTVTSDTGGDTGAVQGGDSGTPDDTGPADDSGGGADTGSPDDDGDGWTLAQGDCDDADPTVHPSTTDTCDGVDQDCDGDVDEDAADAYEPNDVSATELGSLDDDPGRAITASLANDQDVDLYAFSFTDGGLSLFTLDVSLSGIPDGAMYRLIVQDSTTGEVLYNDYGEDSLGVTIDDQIFDDQGGDWLITVSAIHGADCGASYLLSLSLAT